MRSCMWSVQGEDGEEGAQATQRLADGTHGIRCAQIWIHKPIQPKEPLHFQVGFAWTVTVSLLFYLPFNSNALPSAAPTLSSCRQTINQHFASWTSHIYCSCWAQQKGKINNDKANPLNWLSWAQSRWMDASWQWPLLWLYPSGLLALVEAPGTFWSCLFLCIQLFFSFNPLLSACPFCPTCVLLWQTFQVTSQNPSWMWRLITITRYIYIH